MKISRLSLTVPRHGFVFSELLVILGILLTGFMMAGALVTQSNRRIDLVTCAGNQRWLGMAIATYSEDHSMKFPWQVPTYDGGSHDAPNAWFTWASLSNYISDSRLLVCPTDSAKTAKGDWNIRDNNISFAVGSEALREYPNSLVALDRNFTSGNRDDSSGCSVSGNATGFSLFNAQTPLPGKWWTNNLHKGIGNVALADGSVMQGVDNSKFRKLIQAATAGRDSFNSHALKPVSQGTANNGRIGND